MTLTSKSTLAAISTGIVIGLVVLATTVPLGVLAQSQGENEPNDSINAATSITSDRVNGRIVVDGGVDYYSVKATKGETLSVLLTKPADALGLTIYIYDSQGDQIAYKTAYEGDERVQIAISPETTGTYYIQIKAALSGESDIPYTLHLSGRAPSTDTSTPTATPTETETTVQQESEPNDAIAAATAIHSTRVTGEITQQGDADYYSVKATKGETLSVLLTKPADALGLTIYIYDSQGDQIAYKTAYEGDKRVQIAISPETTGTYYIQVEAALSGESGIPYTLSLSGGTVPTATPINTATGTESMTQTATLTDTPTVTPTETETTVQQESEPNDAIAAATAIHSTRVTGEITQQGDADYYSVKATKGETLSVLLTKPADALGLTIYIYDSQGEQITYKTAYDDDNRVQLAITPEKTGTYYIQVEAALSGESGIPYTLSLSGIASSTDTSTPTATPTESTTQTATSEGTTTGPTTSTPAAEKANTPVEKETTSTFGPGFTIVGALLAALAAAFLVIRRR